jgi:hypothetical protein
MLILLSLMGPLWASDIVINEVMVNPDGSDGGAEWVELYNGSEAAVSVSGWSLHWGTNSYASTYTLGPASIPSGEFYVLSGEVVGGGHALATFSFGNAGTNADAVQLRDDAGLVQDTVIYGDPNDDGWLNDMGEPAASLAPSPSSGSSLARDADGSDSDLSGDDFVSFDEPTMGERNLMPVVDPDDPDTGWVMAGCEGEVKINELMPNPEGSGTEAEWVELYNPGDEAVALDGWSIEAAKSGDYVIEKVFDAGTTLGPGGYMLLGGPLVEAADVLVEFSLGDASSGSAAVRLVDCDGDIQDTVVYGPSNDVGRLNDDGEIAVSLAPKPTDGGALGRVINGVDTNRSGDDFVLEDDPTPGGPNPYTEPTECSPGWLWVKINELMPNPEGSGTEAEWVELYNSGDEAVALDGWSIQSAKSGDYDIAKVFDAGTTLEPGGYLLLGGPLVEAVDVSVAFNLGDAGSNSDAVRLVDCDDYVQDTVIYGDANDDGWLNDDDEIAVSLAPKPTDGGALARTEDGVDTERSGDDFVLSETPSPGEANPYTEPPEPVICVPGELEIKINELLPNPEGADAENEFIELYNPTDRSISLDGWGLASGTSSWPGIPKLTIPGGVSIDPSGFVVIGGANIEEADLPMDEDPDMLGNSSKNPDGVRLVDCTGLVQDTVLYGKAGEPIEDFDLLDDADGVSMAGMPRDGLSVGRIDDGVDTDDNEVDFGANMPPTPGASNADAGGGGGDEDLSKGCGCGKSGPGAEDTPAAEAGAVGGALFSLSLFVMLRRREE